MTFPANYNWTKPKEESIRCVQCKKVLYDLGVAEVTTSGGKILMEIYRNRSVIVVFC